jgi:nicotinate-nucleotide adenylyltransferase
MTKAESISLNRIAFYGGAFDPIHNAHIAVAQHASEQADLTKVIFIPSAQSPLKFKSPSCSDEDRIAMLRLAIEGHSKFELDLCEIEAGGVSYTIHTVRKMKERYPDAELFWIIGGDQFELLEHWFAIEALAELVTFLVLFRPGSVLDEDVALTGLNYQLIHAPMMGESSTEIRGRVRKGESIADFAPESVADFIDRRGLYKA